LLATAFGSLLFGQSLAKYSRDDLLVALVMNEEVYRRQAEDHARSMEFMSDLHRAARS